MSLETILASIGPYVGASLVSGGALYKWMEFRQNRKIEAVKLAHDQQIAKLQEANKAKSETNLDHQKLATEVHALFNEAVATGEAFRKEIAQYQRDALQYERDKSKLERDNDRLKALLDEAEEEKGDLSIRLDSCEQRWKDHRCDRKRN